MAIKLWDEIDLRPDGYLVTHAEGVAFCLRKEDAEEHARFWREQEHASVEITTMHTDGKVCELLRLERERCLDAVSVSFSLSAAGVRILELPDLPITDPAAMAELIKEIGR